VTDDPVDDRVLCQERHDSHPPAAADGVSLKAAYRLIEAALAG